MPCHVYIVGSSREVLSSRALKPRMVSDFGILAPLSSALRQLIDDIGFLSIVNTSSFDPVLSYFAYYRSDELD